MDGSSVRRGPDRSDQLITLSDGGVAGVRQQAKEARRDRLERFIDSLAGLELEDLCGEPESARRFVDSIRPPTSACP